MYTTTTRSNFLLNRLLALLLLLVLSPVLIVRAIIGFVSTGKLFDIAEFRHRDGTKAMAYHFSGATKGRGLAKLFSLLSGHLDWVGNKPVPFQPVSCQLLDSGQGDHSLDSHQCSQSSRSGSDLSGLQARPGIIWPERVYSRVGKTGELIAGKTDRRKSDKNASGLTSQEGETCDFANCDEATEATLVAKTTISLMLQFLFSRFLSPGKAVRRQDKLVLSGIGIDNLGVQDVLDKFANYLEGNKKYKIAFVNPDCINQTHSNAEYKESLLRMDHVLGDGIGLQLAAKLLSVELKQNVNGTDLLPLLCDLCVEKGRSIYLLGGKPGIAEKMADNLQKQFPQIQIAGCRDGYFAKDETATVINNINHSKADVLLVAFGAPLQETWIDKHHNELLPRLQIGVGGLFDFFSDSVSRAPQAMQACGLEWVWRLMQEPGRMWRRYILGNPLFVYRMIRQSRSDFDRRAVSLYDGSRSRAFPLLRKHFKRVTRLVYLGIIVAIKRILDIVVSGGCIFLLSPLFIMIAILIKFGSPGPAIFKQTRVGKRGREFAMYKFRSMYIDAEQRKAALSNDNEMQGGVLFKMKNDPRVTWIGKYLRKYSIDEAPQLWNVFIGDMSLVGPRPPVPSEVSQYSSADRRRLEIKPGLTCLWQISGRSELPFETQVRLDVKYVDTFAPWSDLKILLKTIPAVISGKGAY